MPITANEQKTPAKKMKWPKINWKNPVVIVVTLLIVLAIYKAGTIVSIIMYYINNPRPPAVVATAVAKSEKWPRTLTGVARLRSSNGALLKAEMAGTCKEINVEAGQKVKKGDVLLAIDADAERATAKLAELTLKRAQDLRAQGVNTQNDLDVAEANYAQALASLQKKEIRAPFDGQVGIPQVFLGQYVEVGVPLISIESKEVMNADFGVSQGMAPAVEKEAKATLTVDAYPEVVFEGKISGVDPRVSDETLTVGVRAVFDNREGKLLSGMYGSIGVQLKQTDEGVAVPASAVVYSAFGNSVYILEKKQNEKTKKEELIASQAFVKVLATQGDWVLVTGVKEGAEVVTIGHMKLRNGDPAVVDNGQSLTTEKAPKVQES